ncbi:hypothetical protein [Chryseolinea sp. H1M3-3]|uniref:hypothetical protein n=1 Tax=Chryseolinea sp. H1M3-3 TaxID=3034144 RepID=UPI0023EBD0CC|nr:hypothetical protein [Chryseolinea sp. H1M3-3]
MSSAKYLKVISIVIFSWLGVSCSEDDSSPAKSRDIKFEVTGDFTGALSATYVNATGGGANETIPALPWNKTLTYTSTVPSTALSVGATGGVAGQTVTVKVFAGGTLISDTPGVADASGMLVVASPTYIF